MIFPVVMYGCESCTINKAECWRIEAFELLCLESPLDRKEIKPVHPKGNQPWIFTERTAAEAEAPILWLSDANSQLIGKEPYWERLRAGGEGGDRGWDGWMASPTQWTPAWANSRKQWGTEKPGVPQSMELQRVGRDLVTEKQQVNDNNSAHFTALLWRLN